MKDSNRKNLCYKGDRIEHVLEKFDDTVSNNLENVIFVV